MFALTQDKLIMNIEKETFSLILSIINMKLSDPGESGPSSPVKTRKSSKKASKSGSSQEKKLTTVEDSGDRSEDSELYNKLFDRCVELTEKLAHLGWSIFI